MSEYLPIGRLEIQVIKYQTGPSVEGLDILVDGARRTTDEYGIATFDDFPYGSYTVTHDDPRFLPMTITAILNRYLATYRFSVAPDPTYVDPSVPTPPPSEGNVLVGIYNSLQQSALESQNVVSRAWQQIVGYVSPTVSNISNAVSGFGGFVASIIQGLLGSLRDIISGAGDAFAEKTTETMQSAASGSPDWKPNLDNYLAGQAGILKDALNQWRGTVHEPTGDNWLDYYAEEAERLFGIAEPITLQSKAMGVIGEVASLGQVETVAQYLDWVGKIHGYDDAMQQVLTGPWRIGVGVGFEHYLNFKYRPNIPPYPDLINMRVKEVITQDQFNKYLGWMGFSDTWSDYLWTAHFEPASWTDFLTAMRRKRTVSWVDAAGVTHEHEFGSDVSSDEQTIRDLSVLVDYDDRYWSFFKERMYNDLTIREARWLLEGATVDTDRLRDIVHRHGYREDDEELMVEMLRTFQSRPWRNRYLTGLVSAYVSEVMPEEELRSTITAEGFQPEIGDYAVKLGDLRKRVQAAGGPEAVKEKILSLGDLRKLYLADKINETEFINRLTVQGYGYDDIVLLVSLLNDQKMVEVESKRIIELSVPELLNAWRYQEISEDTLRARLMLKGMSQGDTQILINTKRKQWEISPMGA